MHRCCSNGKLSPTEAVHGTLQGGSVLQAAPAVHSEHAVPAGDLNGKALHLEPASAAADAAGVLNQKRSEITAG